MSDYTLKPGLVVFKKSDCSSNGGFVAVSMIMGIAESDYNRYMEKLKKEVSSPYASRRDIQGTMADVSYTGTVIGYLYIDDQGYIFDKDSLTSLKKMIMGVLSFRIKNIDSGFNRIEKFATTYKASDIVVLNDLCVADSAIESYLIKRKMMDKNSTVYHTLHDFYSEADELLKGVNSQLKLYDDITDTIKDIVYGRLPRKKLEKFVPGDLIIRFTAKRYRVLLVLGKNQYTDEVQLLEISNEKHESYFNQIKRGTIESAFRRNTAENARQASDYLQTGFNIYQYFEGAIQNELHQ